MKAVETVEARCDDLLRSFLHLISFISLWQLRLRLLCSTLLLLLLLRAFSLRLSILVPPPLLILLGLLGLLGLAPHLCLLGRAPPHLRLYGWVGGEGGGREGEGGGT